jgi:hypothetical protein
MGLLWVSVTVVTRFCCTPWVTVPDVWPLASVTEMDLGGQVEKYPASEPEPATDAVMTVVPGCSAVISLVSLSMEAMAAVPTENWSAPIDDGQVGICLIEVTVEGSGQAAGVGVDLAGGLVTLAGAQSNTFVGLPLSVPE